MAARRDDDNINRLTRAAAVVLHRCALQMRYPCILVMYTLYRCVELVLHCTLSFPCSFRVPDCQTGLRCYTMRYMFYLIGRPHLLQIYRAFLEKRLSIRHNLCLLCAFPCEMLTTGML
jgi:hypothetical protein